MRRGRDRREKDDMFLRLTLVQVGAALLVFAALFLLIRREDGLHLRIRGEFEQLMAQDWDIAGLFGGETQPAFSAGKGTDGVRLPGAGVPKEGDATDDGAAVILTANRATAKAAAPRLSSAGSNNGNGVLLLAAADAVPFSAEEGLLTDSFYGDDAPVRPVSGPVTSDYGERVHPITGEDSFHSGRDIAAAEGTGISAVYDGTVIATGVGELSGNYVKIDHGDGLVALYCHCSEVYVEEGDAVRKGDIIAAVGQTGAATGPHLHFEIRVNGELQDPAAVLDKAEDVG